MPHDIDVSPFAALARQFVAWCHAPYGEKSAGLMAQEALEQLVAVYAAGLQLQAVDFHPAPDPPNRSPEQNSRLTKNLSALPFQLYWEVLEPLSPDCRQEPGCGDLQDDFLDICNDLSDGLWLFDHGHATAAAFHWHQMFFHWGQHAANAMRVLQCFRLTHQAVSSPS